MDNYCKTCLHDGVDIGFCDKCYYNHILEEKGIPPTKYEAKPKRITNADLLRAMSAEELAMLIHDIVQAEMWRAQVRECITTETGWLDWLKQEVSTNG